MPSKLKLFNIALIFGTVFAVLLSFARFNTACDGIRDSVLRIHILANSDSDEDQALKLRVRDALLERGGDLLAGCETEEEALAAAGESLDTLKKQAEATLRDSGCGLPVAVSLEKAWFDTRDYGDFTLPAGEYDALRVVIGEGKGHNWWCVMFPSVCVGAARKRGMDDLLSDNELNVIENKPRYRIKFKLVEWFEYVRSRLGF